MANILDTLTKGEKHESDVEAKLRVPAAGIDDVRNAVYDFLKKQTDVREVSVVKLVSIDPEKGTWEAEAEVYTPNKAIRAFLYLRTYKGAIRLSACSAQTGMGRKTGYHREVI
jgi:hypothetical protein